MDILKQTNEIKEILDPQYFHTSINIKNKNEIEWFIYYKNLPQRVYYSSKNKPILTSKKNDIEDIYVLKERFEKEKTNEFNNNLAEILNMNFTIYNMASDIKRYVLVSFQIILLLLLGFVLLNGLNSEYKRFIISVYNLAVTLIVSFISIKVHKKISEISQQTQRKIQEDILKEKIRHQGLYFVEKIKKGEVENATNQKTRKKINKSI